MKTLLIIGIGAGDPDYLTVQAIKALNRTDVFFLMDKGSAKDSLIGLRKTICERFIRAATTASSAPTARSGCAMWRIIAAAWSTSIRTNSSCSNA